MKKRYKKCPSSVYQSINGGCLYYQSTASCKGGQEVMSTAEISATHGVDDQKRSRLKRLTSA